MRTFIAIEIGEELRRKIQEIRDRLEQVRPDVKWVTDVNTHLTLKFIGEVSPDDLCGVQNALKAAAQAVEPFEMQIAGVGTFPKRRPKVLWVGVIEESGSLLKLHDKVDKKLSKLGVEREKRTYSPHITLGRVRSGRNVRDLLEALEAEQPAELGQVRVESVSLFQSELTRRGPVYTRLAEYQLGNEQE